MKKNLIILFLIISNSILAQVEFETKVSKQTLAMNETLRVDFVMNADGDNFSPPSFDGFKVIGGPSQQVSQSWVNGKSSFNKTYSYFLVPTQRGTLNIKAASIEINGQTYRTYPVNVTVTDAVEKPRNPNDISINVDQNIFLVAEVSKTNPYVNEPITVVYKLYFSYNIGISNWRELNKPKYNDFWSQNIDIKKLVAEEGKYNNEPFRYVVLRKTVLYPQKSGKLEIEPLSLDIDLQLPTGKRNFWGQMQIEAGNKKVSAGSKMINVKPLPEAGKPNDFSGAVGKFDFKVSPSKTTLKNGESLNLDVKISGTGNLKLFDIPKPVVPSGLEVYEPVYKENVNTPLSGMNGFVSNSYTIVPEFKGNYPIKPLRFSYFDLGTSTYKTISSEEIVLRVLEGPTQGIVENNSAAARKEVVVAENFKFIKLNTTLTDKGKNSDFLGSTTFYMATLLPFLMIPLLIVFKRKKEQRDNDVEGIRTKTSNRLAKKYLTEAKLHLTNPVSFYVALEKALHNFLKAKLKIETSEMSKDKIREVLEQKGAQPTTISEFIHLTENCEFARYAPSSTGAVQDDYTRAVATISELEKQL